MRAINNSCHNSDVHILKLLYIPIKSREHILLQVNEKFFELKRDI